MEGWVSVRERRNSHGLAFHHLDGTPPAKLRGIGPSKGASIRWRAVPDSTCTSTQLPDGSMQNLRCHEPKSCKVRNGLAHGLPMLVLRTREKHWAHFDCCAKLNPTWKQEG